jgi:hypothetical protein
MTTPAGYDYIFGDGLITGSRHLGIAELSALHISRTRVDGVCHLEKFILLKLICHCRCCVMMYDELLEKAMRERSSARLREVCVEWRARYEDMCGDGRRLNSMPAADLHALHRKQKVKFGVIIRRQYLSIMLVCFG